MSTTLEGLFSQAWETPNAPPQQPDDTAWFAISAIALNFILLLVYLNFDQGLGTLYSLVFLFTVMLFVIAEPLSKALGTKLNSVSYGQPKARFTGLPMSAWYLIYGVLGAIIFTVTASAAIGALFGPAALKSIATLAVNAPVVPYLFSAETIATAIISILMIGIFQPVVEEEFFAQISAYVAFFLKGFRNTTLLIIGVLAVVAVLFCVLHFAEYTLTIDRYWESYQNSVPWQNGACGFPDSGDYWNLNSQSCQPIPAEPGTSEAFTALLAMLFWVGTFRAFMTFIGFSLNSKWVMIIIHSLHNLYVYGIMTLNQPIFFVFGVVFLLLLYALWLLQSPSDSRMQQTIQSWG